MISGASDSIVTSATFWRLEARAVNSAEEGRKGWRGVEISEGNTNKKKVRCGGWNRSGEWGDEGFNGESSNETALVTSGYTQS